MKTRRSNLGTQLPPSLSRLLSQAIQVSNARLRSQYSGIKFDPVLKLRIQLGERLFAFATAALMSRSPVERLLGVFLLTPRHSDTRVETKRKVRMLTLMLRTESGVRLKSAVIKVLGQFDLAYIDRIIATYSNCKAHLIRVAVASSVSTHATQVGIRALFVLSSDCLPIVREWAVFRLGQQQCGKRIKSKVLNILKRRAVDRNPSVALNAIRAMAQQGDMAFLKWVAIRLKHRRIPFRVISNILDYCRLRMSKCGVESELIDALIKPVLDLFIPITE